MQRSQARTELVLMPGLDGTGILFQPFLGSLPGDVRCTVVTYPPRERLSMADHVEAAFRQVPKDRPVILVAESFSGAVAAEMLSSPRLNVRAVAFVATFLQPPRPGLLKLARLLPVSWLVRIPMPAFVIRRASLGPTAGGDLIGLYRKAKRIVHPRVLANRLRLIRRLKPPASRIEVPALYIQATRDRLVPAGCLEAFRSAAPHLHVARIDGPHLILQTRPQACWQAIRRFVGPLGYAGQTQDPPASETSQGMA